MNILVVQTGFLGDVVLSTPIISCLRQLYPDSTISVLTTPKAEDLVKYHPDVNSTLIYDKRKANSGLKGLWTMVRVLREKEFDVVFSLHKSWRTALLLWLSKIPLRYGFAEASASWLYSKVAKRGDLKHEVLRNLALLRNIGVQPENLEAKLKIEVPFVVSAKVEKLLGNIRGKGLVGIAPGSVWLTKRWTVEGFSKLAKQLVDNGYQVVLIGGPEDYQISKQIEDVCGGEIVNLVGILSLIESVAVLSKLDLLVSNDSSPLHMASARNIPVVAIFCATVPEFGFGPWQVPHEIIQVDNLKCRPCARHGGQQCPTGTHACRFGISADTVFEGVERLLKDSKGYALEVGLTN